MALRWDPIAEAHRQWQEHGWGEVADSMAAVTSVMRAQQIWQQRIEETLRPYGLSFARFELLRLLSFTAEGAMAMNRAAQRLQVHPTSLGSIVTRLEKDDLLERRPNPQDGRSFVVSLLPAGYALVEAATPELNGVFADIGLDPDDVRTLVTVLARLRMSNGDFTPPSPRRDDFFLDAGGEELT